MLRGKNCERELQWLDMRINEKKSCCLRIGVRFKVICAQLTTSDGYSLPWVDQIWYIILLPGDKCGSQSPVQNVLFSIH